MSAAETIARIRAHITVDPPAGAAVLHMPSAIALLDVAKAAAALEDAFRNFDKPGQVLARADLKNALDALGGR